jgi:hypothetical protein
MKSLRDLWRVSADELAEWCHTSATLDIKTVERRVEDEGFSFLTITLPAFGKALERGLERGSIGSSDFPGFRYRRGLPVFMSGFLSQVFDVDSGALLPQPSIDCIFAIRQLTNLYAKIELPCSNSRIVRAMHSYVEVENEVERWESTVDPGLIERFRSASQLLYADVFTAVDSDCYSGSVQPRHGPGSTADGRLGNQKFVMQNWTQRLEQIFPYGEYCIPNWRYYYLLDHVNFFDPGAEPPVKVIHVPKTLRTPRIIAMEPAHMQFMQQAVLSSLVRELEDPEELVSSFLGFSDQEPNRDLARVGSLTGTLATLDLKEASDRVPYLLVQTMLERFPWLNAGVSASRSSRAEIPELGLCIPSLRKFASMGSALCFPFEAMVFLAIVLIGVADASRVPLSRGFVKSLRGNVRVYGDDIIVPADSVDSVILSLEAFGFRVNKDKSFWNGKFRESCGGDFYAGWDVTPIRLRKLFPASSKDGTRVAALVEFRNHLYLRGMWKTAGWLDEMIVDVLHGHFPIVEPTSPVLGRRSFLPYQAEKVDERTHAPMVKGWCLRPKLPKNSVGGPWALVKCLSASDIFEDALHLERSGRPVVVGTKLRWMTPF